MLHIYSDQNGYYEISTIKPARYPQNKFPAHIHAALKEPGSKPYYINDFVFSDDSLVNFSYLSSLTLQGGSGIIKLEKLGADKLVGNRNIYTSIK